MFNVDDKVSYGEFFDRVKEVMFNYMSDDLSIELFQARLLYITSGNASHIMANATPFVKEVRKMIKENPVPTWVRGYNTSLRIPANTPVVIYGANEAGKVCYETVKEKGVKEIFFCDMKHETIEEFCGEPVMSPEDLLLKHAHLPIIVTDLQKHNEIYKFAFDNDLDIVRGSKPVILYGTLGRATIDAEYFLRLNHSVILCVDDATDEQKANCKLPIITFEQMKENHFEDLILISDYLYGMKKWEKLKEHEFPNINAFVMFDHENKYFDEVIKLTDEEIFVDAGATDGTTTMLFAEKTGGKYKKIYLLEPNSYLIPTIEKNTENLDNIEIRSVGLWENRETLNFIEDTSNPGGGHLAENGGIEAYVDTLDSILKGEEVTYIKLNVVGSELKALKGAKETILKYKPKLAITVHYKPEDIIEIPAYLKSLVPEYKFYMRHYSNSLAETVVYAVI